MNRRNAGLANCNLPKVLWVLLGAALLVRLWGTWHGLPYSYISDEYHEVMRALQLGAGSFNFERTGKGGFYFVLFFEYGVYFLLLKLAGVVDSAQDFAKHFARDPSAFYLMGRVTAALCGTFTVAVLYALGRKAYSHAAGLLAALFLAVNVLHIDLSRRIGVDIPMTLLAFVAIFFALRIAEGGHRKDYVLGALFAALATTTKLPGILVLLPLLLGHGYFTASQPVGLRAWIGTPSLWLAAAVFATVLVVTNPGIIVAADFSYIYSSATQDADEQVLDEAIAFSSGVRPNLYLYYFEAMRESMGWPLFVLGLVSVAYALRKRTRADVLLVSYAVANLVAISNTTSESLYFPRYSLPIIAVLALLTGRAVADLIGSLGGRRVAVTTAIVAVLLVLPIRQSLSTAGALLRSDIRSEAKSWFEANVPAGSKVVIEGGKIGPERQTVPLQDTADAMRRRIAYWSKLEPRQAEYLATKLAVHEGVGYDLLFVRTDTMESLDAYAAQGVEYFVIRPDRILEGGRRVSPASVRLLDDLRSDRRVRLIKRFDGDTADRIGPTIEVYRLMRLPKEAGSS